MSMAMKSLINIREDYINATREKVKEWTNDKADYLEVVLKTIENMTFDSHIQLIRHIILSHAGGEKFQILYNLPFEWDRPGDIHGVRKLHSLLRANRDTDTHLFVTRIGDISTSGGLSIANYDTFDVKPDIRQPYYEAHSFACYNLTIDSDGNEHYEYDFPTLPGKLGQLLLLFGPLIHVKVFNLKIPRHLICHNPGSHSSHRIEVQQGYHIPKDFRHMVDTNGSRVFHPQFYTFNF